MLRNLNNIFKFTNYSVSILILIFTIWITAQCSKVVAQNPPATAVICPCGSINDPTCCQVGDNSCCSKCNCNGSYSTEIGSCTLCRNLTKCKNHKQCASNCCAQDELCSNPWVCYYPPTPIPQPSERPSCTSDDDCLYGAYGDYCCEGKCYSCCTDEHCKNNPHGDHFCVDRTLDKKLVKMCAQCRENSDCPSGQKCSDDKFCVPK